MLLNGESGYPFCDSFADETLYIVIDMLPWYADIVNYIVTKTFPIDLSSA